MYPSLVGSCKWNTTQVFCWMPNDWSLVNIRVRRPEWIKFQFGLLCIPVMTLAVTKYTQIPNLHHWPSESFSSGSSEWHRQCSQLLPGHNARVQYSLGTNVNTPFSSGAHARIWAHCLCPSTRSSHFPRAQKWAPGPCVHTIFVGSGKVNCFVLTAKLKFQNGVWQGEMK